MGNEMSNSDNKESTKYYLGDSVYAELSGYTIILTTENGVPFDPSNKIVIEPDVLKELFRYATHYGVKFMP